MGNFRSGPSFEEETKASSSGLASLLQTNGLTSAANFSLNGTQVGSAAGITNSPATSSQSAQGKIPSKVNGMSLKSRPHSLNNRPMI